MCVTTNTTMQRTHLLMMAAINFILFVFSSYPGKSVSDFSDLFSSYSPQIFYPLLTIIWKLNLLKNTSYNFKN